MFNVFILSESYLPLLNHDFESVHVFSADRDTMFMKQFCYSSDYEVYT